MHVSEVAEDELCEGVSLNQIHAVTCRSVDHYQNILHSHFFLKKAIFSADKMSNTDFASKPLHPRVYYIGLLPFSAMNLHQFF